MIGAGSWYVYDQYTAGERSAAKIRGELNDLKGELAARDRIIESRNLEISKLNDDIVLLNEEVDRLDTALRLLKVDHRLARLTVLDQQEDPDRGLISTVEFVELNEHGEPIDRARVFEIEGDMVYIDNWVVKFDDEYVEQADLLRSTSLVLFRRNFGESQPPVKGFSLDQVGERPQAYAQGRDMSEFERRIWEDFWEIANDAVKASEMGIRAAHGEAPSIKVKKGKTYKIQLRASDGLSIKPDGDAPPREPAA